MADHVGLRYLGHSAFLVTGPEGTRVVIDPYGNIHPEVWRWFLRPMPDVEADIVLVTHNHFDHNASPRVGGSPRIVSSAEEIRTTDVSISGFEDRHATPDDLPNTIFVLEAAGVRICHLGDNRAEIPPLTVAGIARVDVLIVPVDDSSHLLRFWEVNQLIATFDPRIVVPVHYLIPGLTDPGSTLLSPEAWLGTQTDVRRLGVADVHLSRDALPGEREIWVFEPAPTAP
jgi:L-ascorbate metabolism protein UlaG (beta-lactamase superfamily)